MAIISCYECDGKVSDTAASCPHCGAPSKSNALIINNNLMTNSELLPPILERTQNRELIYFDNTSVIVSNTRVLTTSNGKTFAIRNIGAVQKRVKEAPKLAWIIIGVLVAAFGHSSIVAIAIGIAFIAIGLSLKHTYFVCLTIADIPNHAIQSTDENLIDKIIQAINQSVADYR
ncbi:MAG: hypothetical protein KGO49_06345 [Gammaproteobacteria bacterium]|nr:hypothetical protein [Gammaproteobacteria bacterium]